ncbi:MAG: DUF3467 domain-containing protein [Patescibacteria group bacterium]
MPELNVRAQDEVIHGKYANVVGVRSQEREVVLDFISVVNNEGQLVSRIFLNRFTAQELVNALQENMTKWEKMRYEGASKPPEPQA